MAASAWRAFGSGLGAVRHRGRYSVPGVSADDRISTRDEVLAARQRLHRLAMEHGLTQPRVDAAGAVVVTPPVDDPGYGTLKRYASAAAAVVGCRVNVVAEDAPAAAGTPRRCERAPGIVPGGRPDLASRRAQRSVGSASVSAR